MKKKSNHEVYCDTLLIEDFVTHAKEMGFKYITSSTLYSEDGIEMKSNITKENKKLSALKKFWKGEGKKQ